MYSYTTSASNISVVKDVTEFLSIRFDQHNKNSRDDKITRTQRD